MTLQCFKISHRSARSNVLVVVHVRMFQQQSELSAEDRSERFGPLQQHRRAVASLNKQIQQKTKQLEEVCRSLAAPRRV